MNLPASPLPAAARTGLSLCLAGGLLSAAVTSSPAAILYNIVSFDPDDATTTISNTVQYVPSVVSIVVAPGLTGTTAEQLLSLQTINPNAGSGTTGSRFQNSDFDAAQTNGTLIADASANYFTFGISGGAGLLTAESLTFQAKKATGGVATRGYSVQYSVDGGAFSLLGSANVTADRNTAPFDNVTLPLTGSSFQNISSIDFRVNSTGGGVEYTNIAINGIIPEPSGFALTVLGGMLALGRRRR